MAERSISVDYATVHRWVIRSSPELLERFNRRKRNVSRKWHLDETYIKVRGQWKYLYRAIDSNGDTVEFWFSERRDLSAAKRFLRKALKRRIHPMLGFKSVNSARVILSGVEMIHMMRKEQAKYAYNPRPSLVEQLDLLAA